MQRYTLEDQNRPLLLKPVSRLGLFALIVLTCISIARMAIAEQIVNVAVASSETKLGVSGNAVRLISAGKEIEKSDGFEIVLQAKALWVNGVQVELPVRLLSAEPIRVGERRFRGELIVVVDEKKGTSKMTLVHPMSLETYVAGIVASEVPSGWHDEALKAQAIAARTYAVNQKYRRIDQSYHLDSSVIDQVYGGLEKEHSRAEKAARETFGVVLTYEAKPIQAFFHSSCGGRTESAKDGWGRDLPYLPGSKCGYCDEVNAKGWEFEVAKKVLGKALAPVWVGRLDSLLLGQRSKSGRVQKIELRSGRKSTLVDASNLRTALGYAKLKSTLIESVDNNRNSITVHGKGFGHGVGMCQWGAQGMAKAGIIASDILARYYPGTELRRFY